MSDFKIKQLRSTAKVINRIEDGKLGLLAMRIAQHLVVGTDVPFSEDETSKLEKSLGMSNDEVLNVIAGLSELLKEAAYYKMQPNALQNILSSTDLDESQVASLVSAWIKVQNAIFETQHQKSVLPQVSHVSYNLSMEAACDALSCQKNLLARLQLGLKEGDSSEVLDLEFDHEGLSDFHSQLTRIQSQLDALSEKKGSYQS